MTKTKDTPQTQYAGALYRTPHAATMAAVDEFLTATGTETVEDTLQAIADERDWIIDELYTAIQAGDWYLPNVENPSREKVAELVDEWVEDNS